MTVDGVEAGVGIGLEEAGEAGEEAVGTPGSGRREVEDVYGWSASPGNPSVAGAPRPQQGQRVSSAWSAYDCFTRSTINRCRARGEHGAAAQVIANSRSGARPSRGGPGSTPGDERQVIDEFGDDDVGQEPSTDAAFG